MAPRISDGSSGDNDRLCGHRPSEKIEQGCCERVIRIAGDHMMGIGHIDELGMGNELEKLLG
jgi:hypothetical protein